MAVITPKPLSQPLQATQFTGTTHRSWLPVKALAEREVVRFFRQRNRVVAAVVTPLVFWLMLGLGLDRALVVSPAVDHASTASASETTTFTTNTGVGYLAYFFPGVVVLMVLFTAIFTTISVIEDRREGFLQGVLVSPASRGSIVLGKAVGGTIITLLQAGLMLILGIALFGWPGLGALLGSLLVLALIAVGLTGVGLAFAWPMDSTAGYHAVMNLLLMPMWLLSGAVFPVETATGPVKWLMLCNPLTYGQTLLTWWWTGGATGMPPGGPWVSLAVTAAAALLALMAATWVAHRPEGIRGKRTSRRQTRVKPA
ncbi:MAG: ABC transporter permease [Planctomycetota bacterium]